MLKSRLGSKLVDYADLLPFDETAVRLEPWASSDTEKDLFINASYVKTPFGESAEQEPYGHMIATRGPTKHTIEAFWKMVVQQDVKVIVSLCENGATECADYFPNDAGNTIELSHDNWTINLTTTEVMDDGVTMKRNVDVSYRYRVDEDQPEVSGEF